MKDYCKNCEHNNKCPIAFYVNFCKDCADFENCDMLEECDGGHYIECNNGFEPRGE